MLSQSKLGRVERVDRIVNCACLPYQSVGTCTLWLLLFIAVFRSDDTPRLVDAICFFGCVSVANTHYYAVMLSDLNRVNRTTHTPQMPNCLGLSRVCVGRVRIS